jgi:protein arginine N-methyltransferase 1
MSETQLESAKQFDGHHPEEEDYLRYFKSYSFLTHQRSMLEDRKRTGAYFEALMSNSDLFRDKVVLDVGTGSGILAIFAAKAGAKKVYAVEATEMAIQARKLVAMNGFQDVVTVIQGTMESVELPEKVDVIVSEWMGYLLLRESMLDSVIFARDRYLKPGGAMYPSHAQMFWAPIQTPDSRKSREEFHKISEHWQCFLGDMKHFYGVDFDVFSDAYLQEQHVNCLLRGEWADVHPDQIIGKALESQIIDIHTVTLAELKN